MAVAKAFPEPEKGGRGKKNAFAAKEFSETALSKARSIIRLAPDLCDAVLSGLMTVDDAYKKASLRKSEAERLSDRVRSVSRENPELAEAVSAGAMSVDEAEQKIGREERIIGLPGIVTISTVSDQFEDASADQRSPRV